MAKYSAWIAYGECRDYFTFDTWAELGNKIKPHLKGDYKVVISNNEIAFAGKIN